MIRKHAEIFHNNLGLRKNIFSNPLNNDAEITKLRFEDP